MLKTLLLGVATLAVVGSVAYAENASNAPQQNMQVAQADDNNNDAPPPPQGGDDAQQGGNGGGWWQWHHGWHHNHGDDRGGPGMMGQGGPGTRGPGEPGGPGMHGPGGPGMMGMGPHNGFKLHLGKGIDVAVACGKEAIKDCVADAQPLIDAAKAAATAQGQAPAKQ